MSTIPAFIRDLTRIAAAVERNSNLAAQEAALRITKGVIDGTPVDTGLARSNWQASLGSPKGGVVPPYAPGNHLGRSEGRNAQAAFAKAAGTIRGKRPGQPVIVQNNVFYIGQLNDGSSTQAAPAFVQKAIVDGVKAVRGINILKVR